MSGTFRPIDSKREEFRKYLERTGVLDAITKVLVLLYEDVDKPDDALEFVRMNLGDKRPSVAEMEALKTDLELATARVKELELENAKLRGDTVPESGDPLVETEKGDVQDPTVTEMAPQETDPQAPPE